MRYCQSTGKAHDRALQKLMASGSTLRVGKPWTWYRAHRGLFLSASQSTAPTVATPCSTMHHLSKDPAPRHSSVEGTCTPMLHTCSEGQDVPVLIKVLRTACMLENGVTACQQRAQPKVDCKQRPPAARLLLQAGHTRKHCTDSTGSRPIAAVAYFMDRRKSWPVNNALSQLAAIPQQYLLLST